MVFTKCPVYGLFSTSCRPENGSEVNSAMEVNIADFQSAQFASSQAARIHGEQHRVMKQVPRRVDGLQMRAAALVQLGRICLDPSPNATGIDGQAALGQNLGNVKVREWIPQIPGSANRITSPGYRRPLNGFVGVIGMDFLPYQSQGRIFATEPFRAQCHRRSGSRSGAEVAFSASSQAAHREKGSCSGGGRSGPTKV
jgi:hypothetical protein